MTAAHAVRQSAPRPLLADALMAGAREDDRPLEPPPGAVRSQRDRFGFERKALASSLPPVTKAVALVLANHFNAKTGRLDPSYETIAKGAGLKKRATINHVAALIDRGWLAVDRSPGRTANQYFLLLNGA